LTILKKPGINKHSSLSCLVDNEEKKFYNIDFSLISHSRQMIFWTRHEKKYESAFLVDWSFSHKYFLRLLKFKLNPLGLIRSVLVFTQPLTKIPQISYGSYQTSHNLVTNFPQTFYDPIVNSLQSSKEAVFLVVCDLSMNELWAT
jgi:hypothetical protein